MPLASSTLFHLLLCFVSATFVPWQHRCAYVAGRDDPGMGGSHRCGGRPCHSSAAETSTYEAAVARDSAALRVMDAEDQATLVERVSRVEVENVAALASTREDAEGFVQKITLLEGELAVERQAREASEGEH
jgi:hypothetical protein